MRLGLKIGARSIGWCLYAVAASGEPTALLATGVRAFGDGRDPRTGLPLGAERRAVRARRRRRDRYVRRRTTLVRIMVANGLLPRDQEAARVLFAKDPYKLRVAALDQPLALHELGRALFHLAQRRGFRSNRLTERSQQEQTERGMVKAGIAALDAALGASFARSWPEFLMLGGLDAGGQAQTAPARRLRRQEGRKGYAYFVARKHVEAEFDAIWACQVKAHGATLSEALREQLHRIIFTQRPLARRPAGRCSVLPTDPRLAVSHPAVRLRRLYERVNALRVEGECQRELTVAERDLIVGKLRTCARTELAAVASWIGLGAGERLVKGGDDQLEGDALGAALAAAECFGPDFLEWRDDEQWLLIEVLLGEDGPGSLGDRLSERWGIDPDAAAIVGGLPVPDGFDRFGARANSLMLAALRQDAVDSKRALQKVMAMLEQSKSPAARYEQLPYYGEILTGALAPGAPDASDPAERMWGRLANCRAHIAFNQLRRVMNAILQRFGRPDVIVLELAADLRAGSGDDSERERRHRALRLAAGRHSAFLQDKAVEDSGGNRLRLALWEALDPSREIGSPRTCPYCGEEMAWRDLFSGTLAIDRINPFSRSFDDSRANKLLVHRSCKEFKGSQSPFEAWGQTDRWEGIAARSENLAPTAARRIGQRVGSPADKDPATVPADSSRLARLAAQYLGCLYGNRAAVQSVRAGVRALLRRQWGLDTLLADHCHVPNRHSGAAHNRLDYRHQAIDAAVAGLLSSGQLSRVVAAARQAEALAADAAIAALPPPWPGFSAALAQHLGRTIVSHRADHGLPKGAGVAGAATAGRLHNDTAYGFTGKHTQSGLPQVVHRIALDELQPADLVDSERIADPALRAALRRASAGHTGAAFTTALAEFARTDPVFCGIRRLRVHTGLNVIPISDRCGHPYKWVKGDSNYRFDVWQLPGGKWAAQVVTMWAAHQPGLALQRPHPAAKRVLSLFQDDMIAVEGADGAVEIMRVVKFGIAGQITLAAHHESGSLKQRSAKPAELDPFKYVSPTAGGLKRLKARQIRVDVLGRLYDPGFATMP